MSFTEKLKKIINPVTQEPFVSQKESEPANSGFDSVAFENAEDVKYAHKESDEVQETPEYEYEVLLQDARIFHQGCWAPIKTEYIKRPENINRYIQMGVLREINR